MSMSWLLVLAASQSAATKVVEPVNVNHKRRLAAMRSNPIMTTCGAPAQDWTSMNSPSIAWSANKMCPCRKKAYLNLWNKHKEDGGEPCENSKGKHWAADCIFDGPLPDEFRWKNFAVAPYSFSLQWPAVTFMAAARDVFPSFNTFLDVGANVGHFTEEVLKRWLDGSNRSNTLSVLSVEPHMRNYIALQNRTSAWMRDHSTHNVRTVHGAVADFEGSALFMGHGEWGKLAAVDQGTSYTRTRKKVTQAHQTRRLHLLAGKSSKGAIDSCVGDGSSSHGRWIDPATFPVNHRLAEGELLGRDRLLRTHLRTPHFLVSGQPMGMDRGRARENGALSYRCFASRQHTGGVTSSRALPTD